MPASSTLLPQYYSSGTGSCSASSALGNTVVLSRLRGCFFVPESDVPELLDTILATIKKGCSFQSSLFGILQQ